MYCNNITNMASKKKITNINFDMTIKKPIMLQSCTAIMLQISILI